MSKVVIRTHYSVGGKSVGGRFTNYISRRERVDKTINAKNANCPIKGIIVSIPNNSPSIEDRTAICFMI